ncbi:hypothetical protein EG328_003133 [Venturia inaequalis]|uniref:Zn(2)-C6 fungal-type domain-containing protein n=1 Tax=Venturia inaequalis TaxID=5025 RepID=A0A8H3UR21_VENIN|nr:hypothetical protein EG328_003133 [Venturia inaequalis]
MGQDQSSQEPSFKPEMSLSQCFHNIGSTDANLPLLREKNVWIGEGLAAQPQHEKAPPATPNDSEEKLDEVKHDNELFYCEACCNRGFSDSRTGGFNTRSLVKDGQKIRFMDAWHDGAHLTFALGMLCSHRDTKDISFGLVSNDGSIHPDFRLLAVDHIPILFPAQGSDKLVLRTSNTNLVSEMQRRPPGLQDVLPAPELDARSKDADSPALKQNVHYEHRHSSSSPVTASIVHTVERPSSSTFGEEKNRQSSRSSIDPAASTTPTGTPPSHLEPRLSVHRGEDDDLHGSSSPDSRLQRNGSSRNRPSNISIDRTDSTPTFVTLAQQGSTIVAPAKIVPTRIDPAPEKLQSTRQTQSGDYATWYKHDAHGADMGQNMVFGNAPLRVYPRRLSAFSQPVWFCPELNCNRHFDARQVGPEPYQFAGALREHAINEHPPKPLPSTSILPTSPFNRDSEIMSGFIREGSTRAQSTRAATISATQLVPRPASIGSISAEYISPAMVSNVSQGVREETDSLLGSDDDDDSDDAAAANNHMIVPSNFLSNEAYISPYATMPNSASSARPLPPFFAERVQNTPTNPVPRPEPQHGSHKRFGGRACSSCNARKSKCGKERPSCAFCIKRRLQCSYPGEGEATSDSYDSQTESTTNLTHKKIYNISASRTEHFRINGQRAGQGDDDEDEDEETLLADLEAMEKEEHLKEEQRRREEEESARLAREKSRRLAEEADRAESEKNRVKRETVQRLKAEKLRRQAAIAEAEREYEAKREAQKRKYEQEHEELMRKKQKADEERQQYERRSSGIR